MAYSKSIIRRAEQILGYGITNIPGSRQYPVIDGVVYTDLFEGDVEIENYSGSFKKAFNGQFNGLEYYNEIHLLSKCKQSNLELDLEWGNSCFFKEIKDLLDWLQDNPTSSSLDNASVESKKIEDFTVRFKNSEESQASIRDAINSVWGYYIRKPLIISVAREQRNDWRYF
jgi:hypothetical protein